MKKIILKIFNLTHGVIYESIDNHYIMTKKGYIFNGNGEYIPSKRYKNYCKWFMRMNHIVNLKVK